MGRVPWRRIRIAGLIGLLGSMGVLLPAGLAGAGTASSGVAAAPATTTTADTGISGWKLVGSYVENTLQAGEGLATVTTKTGSEVIYRGDASIPAKVAAQGWTHIGDPDSADGDIIDAYQGSPSMDAKMFLVTRPSGKRIEYVHKLTGEELYNNSFDAISPDTRWMVSGTWGTVDHLQVFPTPYLNPSTPHHGGSLPLVGAIHLDHKVNDIQGCDFLTSRKLICASDDDSERRFPVEKPLLAVTLTKAVHGGHNVGHVTDLGPIPQQSTCSGTFEAEGVDYDVATGVLRVEIIQPGACILSTTVYEYRRLHSS